MKKILSILFALFLSLAFTLPAFAADTDEWKETETWDASGSALTTGTTEIDIASLLADGADLLDPDEEEEVLLKLESVSSRCGYDVAVVTVDSFSGYSVDDAAADRYQEAGYSDGIMLFISMAERDWCLHVHGKAQDVVSEYGDEEIKSAFLSDLSDGDYKEAFLNFAEECDNQFEYYRINGRTIRAPYNKIWILIALGGGLLVAAIVTGNMKSKLKSVHYQTAAADYVVPGTMNLTNASDVFLYTSVTRTPRPKESSSSSRSGGGGSYRSSSGKF